MRRDTLVIIDGLINNIELNEMKNKLVRAHIHNAIIDNNKLV